MTAPGAARARRLALFALLPLMSACDGGPEHSIIPVPQQVAMGSGSFEISSDVSIQFVDPSDDNAQAVFDIWATPYRDSGALPLTPSEAGAFRVGVDGEGEPESYRLEITRDGIDLGAADPAGLFYGLQTLSQLMPASAVTGAAGSSFALAAISIDDAPRFAYRGMHLDVARHFFPPEFIKHYIDLLAHYKINRFHWHLTEDQGWRIEIDRYPAAHGGLGLSGADADRSRPG